MKKIIYTLATVMCFAPALTWALDDEMMFPSDSRIKLLPYDESDIYTITTKSGYQTSIVFDPNEEINTISLGDRSLWQIIPSGNRIFLRPNMDDVTTNMTVLTNKRAYNFDLKSVSEDSKNTSIIYVARFVYPEDMPTKMVSPYDNQLTDLMTDDTIPEPLPSSQMPPDAHAQPVVLSQPTEHSVLPAPVEPTSSAATGAENHRYTYAGPDELAPLQVFDDGKSTFFKYRAIGQPLPNAYTIDKDGQEKAAGHYVKNGFMVIDGVAGEWLLKSSAGDIMVYNEMLNPK